MNEKDLDFLKNAYRVLDNNQQKELSKFNPKALILILMLALIGVIIHIKTDINIILEAAFFSIIALAIILLEIRDTLHKKGFDRIYVVTAFVEYTSVSAIKVHYYDFMNNSFVTRNIQINGNNQPCITVSSGDTVELLIGQRENRLYYISLNYDKL